MEQPDKTTQHQERISHFIQWLESLNPSPRSSREFIDEALNYYQKYRRFIISAPDEEKPPERILNFKFESGYVEEANNLLTHLTVAESVVLLGISMYPNRTVHPEQLTYLGQKVYGKLFYFDLSLKSHIASIRKKIKDVQTVSETGEKHWQIIENSSWGSGTYLLSKTAMVLLDGSYPQNFPLNEYRADTRF